MAGLRNSKTVDGVTYNYLTLDGKVVRQTWEQNNNKYVLDIIYDNSGLPYAFKYGGGYYIYVLNQQMEFSYAGGLSCAGQSISNCGTKQ